MGKIKLVKLPSGIKKRVKESIKETRRIKRTGATPYTDKEVLTYVRMYLSGYAPRIIAEYYDVPMHRVYNGMMNHFMIGEYYRQLSALNRKKQKLKHKLVGVDEFFDNEMYTPV